MSWYELFRHFYKLKEYFLSRKCHLEFSSINIGGYGHTTPLFIIIVIIIIIIIIIITIIKNYYQHFWPFGTPETQYPLQLCVPGPCLQASLVLLNAQGSVQSSLVL